MEPVIIVHGGAGAWDLTSARLQAGIEACRAAAAAGQKILRDGGSALDAVEAAVRVLEDAPVLDAGVGSYLNTDGIVEVDALIMDGRTLDLGAVAAVQRVQNPISLARRVMTDTEHTLLVGEGAGRFADQIGFPRVSNEALVTEEERENLAALLEQAGYETHEIFTVPGAMGDTVGAVAIDHQGHLAAATSTGGTRHKLPSRVGDSPLVGSGGYADDLTGAVSATGHGESLMKVVISKQVCDFMGGGTEPEAACREALERLASRLGEKGRGGLIAIDRRGRAGWFYNTDAMPYALARGDDPVESGR